METTPDEMRRRYAAWRAVNAGAYERIERSAVADMRAGRRFSIRPYVERMRWLDSANSEGGNVGIANALVPCIARELMETYPDMVPLLSHSRSKLDSEV
ncbi:hypothetical protein [Slackia sp.]|uniref:hypothetical protein n=1 Tax=Slackia sp. TaxID=2049041 RepID=UPI00257FC411|nr:hypothetical protein [Slackia sp.]MBS6498888.1 hypothetical protein [Slackia sp.]